MTSPRKVQANRKNALKSTGPRTPAGRGRISKNALTHGLLSQDVLLPDEDGKALKALGDGLHADLEPERELETMLVDRIIGLTWRLLRLNRIEAGVFLEYLHTPKKDEFDSITNLINKGQSWAEEQGIEVTDKDLRAAAYGKAFSRDISDELLKLARYESGLDRSLFRTIHELQRLQSARGKPTPAPQAVDITVDMPQSGDNGSTSED